MNRVPTSMRPFHPEALLSVKLHIGVMSNTLYTVPVEVNNQITFFEPVMVGRESLCPY